MVISGEQAARVDTEASGTVSPLPNGAACVQETVLVADIGGTSARFALAGLSADSVVIRHAKTFRSADFKTLEAAVGAYLQNIKQKPTRACFAVAAPTNAREIVLSNLQWRLRTDELKSALRLDDLMVVNDFFALAAGVARLEDKTFTPVKMGTADADAPRLVFGPGTGLGQALIVPIPGGTKIIATEGGHASFAPSTEEEIEVLRYIGWEHPRVSVERVLSGSGLLQIYQALSAMAGVRAVADRADEVTVAALAQTDFVAVRAVHLFCEILGHVAGDAVLATGARGGVLLGGGILPRINEIFRASRFVECFLDKGRMRGYVQQVPVHLIDREGVALVGAAAALQTAK